MDAADGDGPRAPIALATDCPERAAEHFLDHICGRRRLLIALSGGGDSTGLLVALSRILARRPDLQIELYAATVDHGLRQGSRAEADAAGHVAEALGAQHAILTWRGDKPQTGVQAAARSARYHLLAAHARAIGADSIVIGHNLDDNLETLLMRSARSPVGATGMSEAVLVDGVVWAYRPLLGLRRAAIRTYLSDKNVSWAEDPSNDNVRFERVQIRTSQPAGGDYPDFAMLSARKAALSSAAAQFLAGAVTMIEGRIAVVDLDGYSGDAPAHLEGLAALCAFIGGRAHRPGRDGRERLAHFLAGAALGQMTMERVVMERRGRRLFLQRERRGLEPLRLAPGESGVWDQRLQITNGLDHVANIDVGGEGEPIFAESALDGLPPRVRGTAFATAPKLLAGKVKDLKISRLVCGYRDFLPLEQLPIGNFLAKASGLAHFPYPAYR